MRRHFNRGQYQSILDLDTSMCLKVNNLAGVKCIDKSLYYISKLGDGAMYFVALVIMILAYDKPFIVTYRDFFIASMVNLLFYRIVKRKVKRRRPFNSIERVSMLISPPDEFSFPSGHSSAAAVFCYCTFFHFSSGMFAIAMIWLFLVGFSRVYNGVHYPGDVIVGYIMGITFGKLSLTLIYKLPNLIDRI